MTTIEQHAFEHCGSLKKIVLQEGVKSIEDKAFLLCTELGEVTLPSTIEYISPTAFIPRSVVKKIFIPKGTKEKFKLLLPAYSRKLVETS